MDEDGTGLKVLLNEVADVGEPRQQVLRHTIFTLSEEVIAFNDNLLIPRLVPMDPSPRTERDHSGDIMLAEEFAIPRALAIAKVKMIGDLADWRVRHTGCAVDCEDGASCCSRPGKTERWRSEDCSLKGSLR